MEYRNQEQIYNNDISNYFDLHIENINKLNEDKNFFSIYDVSDKINSGTRAYIRSDDEIWDSWRKLILPKISYLSILKLLPLKSENKKPLFYFRIFLDYQFRSIVHPKLINTTIDELIEIQNPTKNSNTSQRQGGDKFRKKVLEHMPQCPFTKISDEK
jgi:predicted restriction endonuclease